MNKRFRNCSRWETCSSQWLRCSRQLLLRREKLGWICETWQTIVSDNVTMWSDEDWLSDFCLPFSTCTYSSNISCEKIPAQTIYDTIRNIYDCTCCQTRQGCSLPIQEVSDKRLPFSTVRWGRYLNRILRSTVRRISTRRAPFDTHFQLFQLLPYLVTQPDARYSRYSWSLGSDYQILLK